MKEKTERNYVRIDFENCGLDYDYTICEWGRVQAEIEAVEITFHDADPKEFEEYGAPKISLSVRSMTVACFEAWKLEHEI